MSQFIIEIFPVCYTIENNAGIRYYWYEFLNGLIFAVVVFPKRRYENLLK